MSMHNIIGVDPGLGGAVVILTVYTTTPPIVFAAERMPVRQDGKGNVVDAAALADLLQEFDDARMAYVERVHSMPGQGVRSMFSFGHATGTVMGVLAALRIPVTTVTPQAWRRRAGIIGKDKDASRSRAHELWPGWSGLDTKAKGQAFADAALIARFGGVA